MSKPQRTSSHFLRTRYSLSAFFSRLMVLRVSEPGPLWAVVQALFIFVAPGVALAAGPSVGEAKATYSLESDGVSSILAAESRKRSLVANYLLPSLKGALEATPAVSHIRVTYGDSEVKEPTGSEVYRSHTRTSYVTLALAFPARATFLLKAKESYRTCLSPAAIARAATTSGLSKKDKEGKGREKNKSKNGEKDESEDEHEESVCPEAAVAGDSEGSASQFTCSLKSEVEFDGPLAVYGTFSSSSNPVESLRSRQKLTWRAESDCKKNDTVLTGHLYASSARFEEGLVIFLKLVNLKVDMARSGEDRGQDSTWTRREIFTGVARAMRLVNENMFNQ